MSQSIWTDCMPPSSESFMERSEKRHELLAGAVDRFHTTKVSPLTWAFLQIADLEQLEKLTANHAEWDKILDPEWGEATVTLWRKGEKDLRPGSGYTSQLCKDRDRWRCVISLVGGIDACYLYPRAALNGEESDCVSLFWKTLALFWTPAKVDAWRGAIFPNSQMMTLIRGTDTLANRITLTATLHGFHIMGAFALRPVRISEDRTQLELEFHWLIRQTRDSQTKVALMEKPASSRGLTGSLEPGITFYRFEDPTKPPQYIPSGTRFVMNTDDPVRKPLPDPGLLEMQWHLQRVLAMSGAARWKDGEDE